MYKDMPLGFVNALAKNESAMQKFAQMEKDEKKIVLEKAHNVSSKQQAVWRSLDCVSGKYLWALPTPTTFEKVDQTFIIA